MQINEEQNKVKREKNRDKVRGNNKHERGEVKDINNNNNMCHENLISTRNFMHANINIFIQLIL